MAGVTMNWLGRRTGSSPAPVRAAARERGLLGAIRGAALVVTVLLVAACDSPQDRAQKHFTRGQSLVAQSETAKARLEFRNAIRLDPRHAGARWELGLIAERDGSLRNAVSNFTQVAEIDPSHLQARLKIARYYIAGGALDEARRFADEAYALAPDDPEVLSVRAALLYRLGNRSAAIAAAERAIELAPDHTAAHLVLLGDMLSGDRRDEGVARLDALLERLPRDEALNLFKLRLLVAAAERDPLVAHLERLIDLFPENVSYRQALAQLHVQAGDTAAAEEQIRAVIAQRPDDAGSAVALVQLVWRTRGAEAAVAEIESLLGPSPDPNGNTVLTLRFALAEIMHEQGRSEEARAMLAAAEKAATRPAAGDRVRVQLARHELSAGNSAAAKALVDRVIGRDGDNVEALSIRARIEIDDYRPEDAILTLRRALSVEPENAVLLMLEARAHERNGNPALAIERLAAATRASGFDPDMALPYAIALRQREQVAAAETVVEETARRHRGNPRTLQLLAELRLALGDYTGAEAAAAELRAVDGQGRQTADRVAALSLLRQGRVAEGVTTLERLVEAPETTDAALATLVATYVQTGETPRAVELLDRLIAENAANVRAQILRAELHLLAGERPAAGERLRELVRVAPADPTVHLVLARFQMQSGDAAEAERTVRAGIEAVQQDTALRLLLAGMLEGRGAFDEALAEYEALYQLDPESVVVANNYASLLAEFREGDAEALAQAARVARRLRGSRVAHFQDTYGWVAFLSGNVEEARRVLVEAAAGLPSNPLVRYHLGRVLATLGEADRARAELEAALAIDPNFPKAASARSTIAGLAPSGG